MSKKLTVTGLTAGAFGIALAASIQVGGAAAESGKAVFGFSGWSVGYLPTAIAIDRLNEKGYEIEVVELGGNSNQLQAAATGDIDITAIAQVMDAIDQGLDFKFFQAANTNEFLMVSRAEYTTCESLGDKAVGIHSVGSFVGQLAIQWFAADCPDAKPNLTVVEGSENRLAALLAGQLDASPVDLQDWTLLNRERPDEFVVTQDFTQTMPILRAAFAAKPSFMVENEQLIKDWIRTHIEVYREIYEDPEILVEKGRELLDEIDADALPAIVEAFTAGKVWPVDGGLSDESVQETIDFFNNDGEAFEKISSPGDVVDRTYLEAVLAE